MFGGQTITFVALSETGSSDELGILTLTETTVDAPGCRHRPLTFKETAELEFDVATEMWKSTIPIGEYSSTLLASVLAAKSNDVIEVDGKRYQIVGGIRPHPDMDGTPFKATLISTLHIG